MSRDDRVLGPDVPCARRHLASQHGRPNKTAAARPNFHKTFKMSKRNREEEEQQQLDAVAKFQRAMDDARNATYAVVEYNKMLRARLDVLEVENAFLRKSGQPQPQEGEINSPIIVDEDEEEQQSEDEEEEDSDDDEPGESDIEDEEDEVSHVHAYASKHDKLHWCDQCHRVTEPKMHKIIGDPARGIMHRERWTCGNKECGLEIKKMRNPRNYPFYCGECNNYQLLNFYEPKFARLGGQCGECQSDDHPITEAFTRRTAARIFHDDSHPLHHFCKHCSMILEAMPYDKPDANGNIGECTFCHNRYDEIVDPEDMEFVCDGCKQPTTLELPPRITSVVSIKHDGASVCKLCAHRMHKLTVRE